MKFLRTFSRILVSLVFVFSGFVKAIDPLGSTYKFTDYFNAFGLGFLSPVSLFLAVLLSSAELLIGISLLMGYRMKVISWAVLLFTSFFTILTLILAFTNPVTDCGCFGDALILTNWETFGKNIILLFFVIVIFKERKKFQKVMRSSLEWLVLSILFGSFVLLSIYSYRNLPAIDFLPFSKGVNIPSDMTVPENAPVDIYETNLVYMNKSTGKQETFTIENIPEDSTWEFVSSESKIISKGYEAPIHTFEITKQNGQEITNEILGNSGYTFILVAYNINEANKNGLIKADNFNKIAGSLNNFDFYALTASNFSDIDMVKESLRLSYEFYSVDEIVLKTMIRSNPGLILIKNGTLLVKWSFVNIPTMEDLGTDFSDLVIKSSDSFEPDSTQYQFSEKYEAGILSYLMKTENTVREKYLIYIFILGFIVIALIIRIFLEEIFHKRK